MLDPLFRYVGNALSTPEDYVKVRPQPRSTIWPPLPPPVPRLIGSSILQLVFCLLIAYPLSSLYVKLPTDGTRHYYSILVATVFLVGILKLWSGFLQLLFSIVGTYLIVVFNRTERMPWLVFAFTMGHLTINHVYRTIYEISPDVIEITGTQMVLVMKLSSFAWNVYDGRRDINVRSLAALSHPVRRGGQVLTRSSVVPANWHVGTSHRTSTRASAQAASPSCQACTRSSATPSSSPPSSSDPRSTSSSTTRSSTASSSSTPRLLRLLPTSPRLE